MAQQRVELIKPYGVHAKGAVLTLDKPIAALLIQTKRAKEVERAKRERKTILSSHADSD